MSFNRSDTVAEGALGPGAKLILAVNTLFVFGVNFSNTFVNVFIWKLNDSLALLAWYHLYQFTGLAAGFVIGGKLAEASDRVASLRTGVVLHALFFAAVLMLGEDAGRYIGRLGVLLGLGSGFYWLGANVLAFDLTGERNVDYFHGLFSLVGSLGAMFAPLIAGLVINRSSGLTGYSIVFAASLAMLVAAIGVSFALRKRDADGAFTLEPAILPDFAGSRWPSLLVVQLLNGFRNGVFIFLIGILVFRIAGGELGLGVYWFFTGAVTLLTSYLVGRWVSEKERVDTIFWGLAASVLGVLALAFLPGLWGLVAFGLLEAIAVPAYGIPFGSLNFDVIDDDPRAPDRRVEYMVAREIPLNVGRLQGLALFISLGDQRLADPSMLRWVLVGYGLLPALGWAMVRRTDARY